MTDRIGEIVRRIPRCETFADVGCDHGLCSKYVLENSLAKTVYVTDISEKCLKKAETLLRRYVAEGRCVPVCCDGLDGLDFLPECVLMAGIGGEIITEILGRSGLPEKFVLQPMRNFRKVRSYLLSERCVIDSDDIFFDGKYYFIISGRRAEGGEPPDIYSEAELNFGRDSLRNPVMAGYLDERIEAYARRLEAAGTSAGREAVEKKLAYLEELKTCIRKNF